MQFVGLGSLSALDTQIALTVCIIHEEQLGMILPLQRSVVHIDMWVLPTFGSQTEMLQSQTLSC